MSKKKATGVAAPETRTYRLVDGKALIQRRLVLAQMEQLIERLGDVEWPDFNNFNLLSFHNAIGAKLPVALAIVLTPEGQDPREKDIDKLADEIHYGLPIDEGIRALSDFFTLNPTASIVRSLRDLLASQSAIKAATGSRTSSLSSAGETSPGETE